MKRHTLETTTIEPPYALRRRGDGRGLARRLAGSVSPLLAEMRGVPPEARVKPIAIGSLAAVLVAFGVGVGPLPYLAQTFFGAAGAQESEDVGGLEAFGRGEEPSEADKAALRYFAREGDVQRLEAELRRLRALYPGWQPERNLLDPEGEDQQLQRVWNLFGEGRYQEALAAIRERQEQEPGWNPPPDLARALELAIAREELVAAADEAQWQEVLSIASENEALLTCNNVDALWRVAEAFAETGRTDRAYDAYAYVLENCEETNERVATLQKASQVLDPEQLTTLFEFERQADVGGEFEAAKLDIMRAAIARGGEEADFTVPREWLETVSASAREGNTGDAMLIGWYLFRKDNPQEAAGWFRFAMAEGHGAPAAEGYIVALRATQNRENETLAREVAYQWRNESPTLMEIYLNSVASLLTSDFESWFALPDVTQDLVERFVPVVLEQQDANGAQALGWYSFNTCQFIIAEEWFITSANWEPTESALFGLALSRLRLGDLVGFYEVVDEWGSIYDALESLARGLNEEPDAPLGGSPDDPTPGTGLESLICDPEEIQRLRERAIERGEEVVFLEAGSTTAGTTVRQGDTTAQLTVRRRNRPDIPRRDDFSGVRFAQATPERTDMLGQPAAPRRSQSPRTSVSARDERGVTPTRTVERRVRRGEPRTIPGLFPGTGAGAGAGGTAAQNALSAGNYTRCVAITNRAMRSGRLSSDDALARGFCLLELERPVEAGQAFQLAFLKSRYASTRAQDAVLGETLAYLASEQTDRAAHAATKTPLSRSRRTQLGIDILTQRALAAYEDERYVEAIMYLNEREQIAPLQKDLMLLRGYAHLNLGQRREAERLFEAVNRASPNGDTRSAVNLVTAERYNYDTGSVCDGEPVGRCYYFERTAID